MLDHLQTRQLGSYAVCQGIDSTLPAAASSLHVLAPFAEFGLDLIIQRTVDGLAAARAPGRKVAQVQTDPDPHPAGGAMYDDAPAVAGKVTVWGVGVLASPTGQPSTAEGAVREYAHPVAWALGNC